MQWGDRDVLTVRLAWLSRVLSSLMRRFYRAIVTGVKTLAPESNIPLLNISLTSWVVRENRVLIHRK